MAEAKEESFLFRDSISKNSIGELAKSIKKNFKSFDDVKFKKSASWGLSDLSLMERVSQVTQSLHTFLPKDFKKAVTILVKSLPPELPQGNDLDGALQKERLSGFGGFIMVAMTNYISTFGLDDFETSMGALKEMTKSFSSEFSTRYFIKTYPHKTLKLMSEWVKDPNMHVRRLVSESTRPKLPWGIHLKNFIEDPSPVLPLLEKLKNDETLYVRRSVANHLNDITKDHPKLVTDLLKEWSESASPQTEWVIRHALRTLIKKGDPEALSILGYKSDPKIMVGALKLKQSKVSFGDDLEFSVKLTSESNSEQQLMIDYVLHHMKANGKLSPKVFKFKKVSLKPGEKLLISKKHSIKEITTRKYYAGEHIVQLQINGKLYPKKKFELIK